MKISIVIPCYNGESYLDECLRSVRSLNYKDFEVIVINDGSTDNSASILKEWKNKKELPIKIHETANKGSSKGRNIGTKLSDGEYIQFLDVDDKLLPAKLAHQVSLISKSSALPDLIASGYRIEYKDGISRNVLPNKSDPWIGLFSTSLGVTSANLFKRESLIKAGGFDENLASSQEYDLMFRMMQYPNATVMVDTSVYTIKRNINPAAISFTNEYENTLRYIELRIRMREFLEEEGDFTENLKNAWYQSMFTAIKRLYKYNTKESICYYKKWIPDNFQPKMSGAISGIYQKCYRLFGYRSTQKIYSLKRRILNQK